MGRLKKDHDNYKTSGLWEKYKYPRIFDLVVKTKPKKDTKKWCKGKVGTLHEYELIIPKNESKTIRGWRKVPTCKNCERQDYRNTVYLNKKTGEYESHVAFWGEVDED